MYVPDDSLALTGPVLARVSDGTAITVDLELAIGDAIEAIADPEQGAHVRAITLAWPATVWTSTRGRA